MNVLGISAYYHESSCALLRDGVLTAAAAEERFSRRKHDASLPVRAFRYCLEAGGLDIVDLDAVAYYERPVAKLSRQLWSGLPAGGAPELPWLDAGRPEREIRERLGWDGPLLFYDHHRSHAASAYYYSGFESAAILTVDGVGEWATTTYGEGDGAGLELFDQVDFPHSLGLLYSAITAYLGFRVNSGEYKVMGLAPYGEPRYAEAMAALIHDLPGGQYELDTDYFDFLGGSRMFSERLCELLGQPPRVPESEITPFHCDVARSLQQRLEQILLAKVAWLHERTGADRLCTAGGVALNCVANGRIRRQGPFRDLFVQPAAGDAGGCLGAAALAHVERTGERPRIGEGGSATRPAPQRHALLGPRWSADEVGAMLESAFGGAGASAAEGQGALAGLDWADLDYRGREAELLATTAERLAAGQTVGWFQGRMEHGPRSLGARSILASPLVEGMRERINRAIKRRESFRPFAPAVLAALAGEHFDLGGPSASKLAPFMLETCAVRSPLAMPAITHVDGSARPQVVAPEDAPRFAALLAAFERRTGCPVLLNTSFNLRGEPIVCTPADALGCFAVSGLDALVIEDFLIDRAALPASWTWLAELLRAPRLSAFAGNGAAGVSGTLYTFV